MVIKDTFKKLELTSTNLIYKSLFRKININYSNIGLINISIPKFDTLPGSGYSYSYLFIILTKNSKPKKFSIVLDRNEEKELLKLLKDHNIQYNIKYYDNSYNNTKISFDKLKR